MLQQGTVQIFYLICSSGEGCIFSAFYIKQRPFLLVTIFASRAAAEPYDGVIKGMVVVEGTFCVFAHFWRLNAYESV